MPPEEAHLSGDFSGCDEGTPNSKEAGVKSVTLEQLIALNREISALSAADVPLAEGLVRVANDFSGPTSELAKRLAQRITVGQSLNAALDEEGEALPETYRALVQAGMQSGRLTSALEGYTNTATRMAELRRVAGLATLYPVFLLVSIWILFLFLNNNVLPEFDWLNIGDRFWVQPLRFSFFSVGSTWRWLLWALVPLSLIAGVWFWWSRSAAAADSATFAKTSWLGWLPGVAHVRQFSSQANFADLLRLFVEQQMPLTIALPLAAKGSGINAISSNMRELSAGLEAGQPLRTKSPAFQKLPPLIRLALLNHCGTDALASSLRRAAEGYSERAQSWAQGVAFYLPLTITTVVGGTAVLAYTFLTLQPYVATLYETMQW